MDKNKERNSSQKTVGLFLGGFSVMIPNMMQGIYFDSHSLIKRLTSKGMPEEQAELLVDGQITFMAQFMATKADLKPLATKTELAEVKEEIAEVKAELKQDISSVREEISYLRVDMKSSQITLIKWLVPLLLGQAAVIAALVKFL